MSKPTVAILGASPNRARYSNISIRAHLAQGFEVFPVNPRGGQIEGLTCYATLADLPVEKLDSISVYLSPPVGLKLLPEIAAANADKVYFNPGADSAEVMRAAQELGIPAIQACSIIAIGSSPGEFLD